MPRYRFSETVVYKSGAPWPTYEAGKVYDLTEDFGDRWVRRQVATRDMGDGAAFPDPRFPLPPVATPPVPDVVAEPEPEPEPVPVRTIEDFPPVAAQPSVGNDAPRYTQRRR